MTIFIPGKKQLFGLLTACLKKDLTCLGDF